jgi:hypothetical protein
MSKRSRDKGNEHERKVAKLILAAVGPPFCAKDCYRTPLSGGHPHADGGDLCISPALRKIVPFTVESKHDKSWRVYFAFTGNKLMQNWMDQAIRQENDPRAEGRTLLLVMSGNNTGDYCVVSLSRFRSYVVPDMKKVAFPFLVFIHARRRFVMFSFEYFLKAVKRHAHD